MSFGLVYEYGFLGEDFNAVGGDLVGSRLHVNRGLSHLLHLENPVVRLADFGVGHYDDTVSKVFLELNRPLDRGTHRSKLGSHQACCASLDESVDQVQNGSSPLDHLGVLEYQRSDRVDHDSLSIYQFGVSLDSFDKAEDRKVFPSDGLSPNLDLAWHVAERGRVDERELFALLKLFELPSEKRHLAVVVCLCLV